MPRQRAIQDQHQIIDAAYNMVERDGMEALTIRGLSKELNVSSMTLYNYFAGMRDINREIHVRCFNEIYRDLYDNMRKTGTGAGIGNLGAFAIAYALALYDFAERHPNLGIFLLRDGLANFSTDAELRLFFKPFHTMMRNSKTIPDTKENHAISIILENIVFATVLEHCLKIRNTTREEFEYYMTLSINALLRD